MFWTNVRCTKAWSTVVCVIVRTASSACVREQCGGVRLGRRRAFDVMESFVLENRCARRWVWSSRMLSHTDYWCFNQLQSVCLWGAYVPVTWGSASVHAYVEGMRVFMLILGLNNKCNNTIYCICFFHSVIFYGQFKKKKRHGMTALSLIPIFDSPPKLKAIQMNSKSSFKHF